MGAGEAHSARCLLLHVLAKDGTAVDDIMPFGIWRTALVLKGGRYDAAAGIAVESIAECNFCRPFVRGSQRLGGVQGAIRTGRTFRIQRQRCSQTVVFYLRYRPSAVVVAVC